MSFKVVNDSNVCQVDEHDYPESEHLLCDDSQTFAYFKTSFLRFVTEEVNINLTKDESACIECEVYNIGNKRCQTTRNGSYPVACCLSNGRKDLKLGHWEEVPIIKIPLNISRPSLQSELEKEIISIIL